MISLLHWFLSIHGQDSGRPGIYYNDGSCRRVEGQVQSRDDPGEIDPTPILAYFLLAISKRHKHLLLVHPPLRHSVTGVLCENVVAVVVSFCGKLFSLHLVPPFLHKLADVLDVDIVLKNGRRNSRLATLLVPSTGEETG